MTVPRTDIADSVLDTIGNTPLVRLSRIEPDLDRDLLIKLEMLNPGVATRYGSR